MDLFAQKLADKGEELDGLTDRQKVQRLNPVLVPIDEASSYTVEVYATLPRDGKTCCLVPLLEQVSGELKFATNYGR